MTAEKNELENLYETSFRSIEEGAVIKGKIVAIIDGSVILDIGYKSEGVVPIEEFSPEERAQLKSGDELEVFVSRLRDQDGMVSLSRDRALRSRVFQQLQSAFRSGTPVRGRIVQRIKGGFYADIMGVRAFVPGSQVDIRPLKDIDRLLNEETSFKILKLNSKLTNIIVSRRAVLEEERDKHRQETLTHLKEGESMRGIVKNITDYGVFVDLGGIDGLLHISDISWGRISHPSEVFTIGDSVEVLVLGHDTQTNKVTLGYKQLKPDPWAGIEQRYPAGTKIKGTVVSITDYGVFLEVEDGVEGLVHISELDWNPRPKHPSKYVSKGEVIEAQVLKVDSAERRLSLSLRQLKPKPWDLVAQRYTVGRAITGKIRSLTEFGAFVSLPEGIDALIHISDISWTRHIKHPSEILRKGQKVDALILSIDPVHEKMALGIKQLTEDPWKKMIPETYHLGDEVTCSVLRTTDYGVFVEINNEVEGLIYSSEIESPGGGDAAYREGDMLRAKIIRIEPTERKIGLSMKNLSPAAPQTHEGGTPA